MVYMTIVTSLLYIRSSRAKCIQFELKYIKPFYITNDSERKRFVSLQCNCKPVVFDGIIVIKVIYFTIE